MRGGRRRNSAERLEYSKAPMTEVQRIVGMLQIRSTARNREIERLSTDIILIGPMGAGKTTLGKLLADHLRLPQCSMDTVSLDYYKEIGYSEETEQQIEHTEGIAGRFRYWKPFEAHAVERLLAE